MFQQLNSLGVSFTGYAIGTNSEWPFVTIRDFEAQASHFSGQSRAYSVSLSMVVSIDQREVWDEYAVANQGWIEESFDFLKMNSSNLSEIDSSIFGINQENGTRYKFPLTDLYAPLWMASPADKLYDKVNHNWLDDPVFNNVYVALALGEPIAVVAPDEGPTTLSVDWPRSAVAIPMFEDFEDNSRIVAVLTTSVSWHTYFEGILEEGLYGVLLAVEDTCGKSFLYEIDGPTVTYIGVGDIDQSGLPEEERLDFSTTSATFNLTNGCPLRFRIYPSPELQEASSTDTPLAYTVTVVVIFVTMGIFFCVYDRLVSKLYDKSVSKVAASKTLFDSVFPSNARDRVLDIDEAEGENYDPVERSRQGSIFDKPIAELHPSATVLFADIANFSVSCIPRLVFTSIHGDHASHTLLCSSYRHGARPESLPKFSHCSRRSTVRSTNLPPSTESSRLKPLGIVMSRYLVCQRPEMTTRWLLPALRKPLSQKCKRLSST